MGVYSRMTDLGIVILNWNTRDLLQRCLETVYASEGDFAYQVVVVDNASTDGKLPRWCSAIFHRRS